MLALALSAPGCIVFPHLQREAPALAGELRRDGEPMRNVSVHLEVNSASSERCTGGVGTRTDESGRFAFSETTYFTPVFLFGDRRDFWQLCIHLPTGERAFWTGSGWWGGPTAQRLRCDIGRGAGRNERELKTVDSPSGETPGCSVAAR
jgi:hypothetical protein